MFKKPLNALLPVTACALVSLICIPAIAAPINYGNFAGSTVNFLNVTEDSATDPTPLFGAPTVAGDGMSFSPLASFTALASAGSIDLTDGKLNTTIQSINPGTGSIQNIVVNERGDYTLAGVGTTGTSVSVSAPVFLTLDEVDGVAITPVALYSGNLAFTPSAGSYNLVSNPGNGIIWTGTLSIDVTAALLAHGIGGRATKLEYTMDNSLLALSQVNSIAKIEKKNGIVGITVNPPVPEPSSIALLGIGTLGLLLARLRRRQS